MHVHISVPRLLHNHSRCFHGNRRGEERHIDDSHVFYQAVITCCVCLLCVVCSVYVYSISSVSCAFIQCFVCVTSSAWVVCLCCVFPVFLFLTCYAVVCGVVVRPVVFSYVDPAECQQVVLVLEAEQFLHVLHVAVVGAGRLFGDDHMCQQKLVVCLRARQHQSVKSRKETRRCVTETPHQTSTQDAACLNASRCVAAGQQKEPICQLLGKHHPPQTLHPRSCTPNKHRQQHEHSAKTHWTGNKPCASILTVDPSQRGGQLADSSWRSVPGGICPLALNTVCNSLLRQTGAVCHLRHFGPCLKNTHHERILQRN